MRNNTTHKLILANILTIFGGKMIFYDVIIAFKLMTPKIIKK